MVTLLLMGLLPLCLHQLPFWLIGLILNGRCGGHWKIAWRIVDRLDWRLLSLTTHLTTRLELHQVGLVARLLVVLGVVL